MAFPTTNLQSYWSFDIDSTDLVGTNNGTDTAITYNSGNGKINKGAGFNGTTSKITFGNGQTFPAAYSFSFWFKTSQTGVFANMFTITDSATGSTGGQVNTLQNNTDKISFGGSSVITTPLAYNDGNFHHCVVTVATDTSGIIYIDGASKVSGTVDNIRTSLPTAYIRLGVGGALNNFLSGALDEVGFWTRTLTAGEVTTLYNGGAGLQYGVYVSDTTITSDVVSLRFGTLSVSDTTVTSDSSRTNIMYNQSAKGSTTWTNTPKP